jgi:hypothetical protein
MSAEASAAAEQAGRETTRRHESGHAAAVLRGIPFKHLQVGGLEHEGRSGIIRYDHEHLELREIARDMVVVTLAGPLNAGEEPPSWPLSEDPISDEGSLKALADFLPLDERDYNQLVIDAYELVGSREFARIADTFEIALERSQVLNAAAIHRLRQICDEPKGTKMERRNRRRVQHKTVPCRVVAIDGVPMPTCQARLAGTSLDPIVADGSPVASAAKSRKTVKPIRIAEFALE